MNSDICLMNSKFCLLPETQRKKKKKEKKKKEREREREKRNAGFSGNVEPKPALYVSYLLIIYYVNLWYSRLRVIFLLKCLHCLHQEVKLHCSMCCMQVKSYWYIECVDDCSH